MTRQLQARPEATEFEVSRTALIVVDMQNGYCTPGGYFGHLGVDLTPTQQQVIPAVARLVKCLLLAFKGIPTGLNAAVVFDALALHLGAKGVHWIGRHSVCYVLSELLATLRPDPVVIRQDDILAMCHWRKQGDK